MFLGIDWFGLNEALQIPNTSKCFVKVANLLPALLVHFL